MHHDQSSRSAGPPRASRSVDPPHAIPTVLIRPRLPPAPHRPDLFIKLSTNCVRGLSVIVPASSRLPASRLIDTAYHTATAANMVRFFGIGECRLHVHVQSLALSPPLQTPYGFARIEDLSPSSYIAFSGG